MKNITIGLIRKTILCAAVVFFPAYQGLSQCYITVTTPSYGVESQCPGSESGIAWSDGHCGEAGYVHCYGSYPVALPYPAGLTSCTQPELWDYYDSGPCSSSVSVGWMTLCVATFITAEGAAAAVVVAECVTPAGLITLGTGCAAAVGLGLPAADAATAAACAWKTTHSCDNPSQTQTTPHMVYKNSATGKTCPS